MKNDRIPGENTRNILKSKFPSCFRLVRIIIHYIHRVLLQIDFLGDLCQKVIETVEIINFILIKRKKQFFVRNAVIHVILENRGYYISFS